MPRIGETEESEEWERVKVGTDIGQRLANIYDDSVEWRERAGYEKSYDSLKQQRVFNQQLRTWGKHVLQMQTVDEYEGDGTKTEKLVEAEMKKGQEARRRLKRKKVRVADLEDDDNNLSLKLDKEWSTAGWPKEDVEDAVSVMFEIFYAASHSTEESKKLACGMLVKLINRHEEALDYVKQNIGQLAGLAASRFLRGGKSAGVLDLLHIVNACKDRFVFELSECMFTARAHDMIAIEIRLAAMLIQHMVRTHQLFRRRARREVNPITQDFGNDEDFMRDQMRNIVARRADLKARWRSMHAFMKPHETATNIGLRAPAYLRRDFTSICLEITLELVSDRAGKYANSNREDVLRTQGAIFYAQVIGTSLGPFIFQSLNILAQVSKMPESLAPLLHSGCVDSILKYMQFMMKTGKADFVSSLRMGHPSTWNETEEVLEVKRAFKLAFFDCIQVLANLASHAAGVHRASNGYNYARTCPIIKEDINYLDLHRETSVQYTGKPLKVPLLDPSHVVSLLCNERCLNMLSTLVRDTTNLNLARNVLRTLYGLCCSAGMRQVVQELVMEGGRTLSRILELVEEEDSTVSSLCLSLLLQAATLDYARSQLFYARIPRLLSSYLAPTQNYQRQAYQRYALIAASLLRQQNWRAYEPVETARAFADSAESVRVSVYKDLLKTIKNVPVTDTMESEHLTVADLVVLKVHGENSRDLAVIAEELGVRAIADFVSHPHDGDHFVSLDWAESVAGCQILEALCCGHKGTMQDVYSVGLAHYLGKCLHLSRFLFDPEKPPLKERMLVLVLNGVRSAANALAAICRHIHHRQEDQEVIIQGIRHSDVLGAAQFFVASLTAEQHVLDAPLVRLQQDTGMSVASFYTEYLRMLDTLPDTPAAALAYGVEVSAVPDVKLGKEAPRRVSKRKEELMRELEPMGAMAVKQVKGLVSSLGSGSVAREILDVLCLFLLELVKPAVLTDLAIYQWHIFEALEKNLPRPLAAVGDPDLGDVKYIQGLGYLPVSLLDLVATMNQLDQGALHTLNHGFLRRALEKLRLLALKGVLMDPGTPEEERMEHRRHAAGCLRLIASVGAFSKQAGGSANDVILMDKYDCVEICHRILSCRLDHDQGGFKCDEPIIIAALAVLGRLSEDNFRVKEVFERFDILGEAGRHMTQVGQLPREGVVHCLEIVHNISTITSDYVTRRLPAMETPIQKVNRMLPELNKVVIDLTWKIAVRLNSFDDSHVAVDADEVFTSKEFYSSSEKAQKKLFSMDRILARRLETIYNEADIPLSARGGVGVVEGSGGGADEGKADDAGCVSPLAAPPLHKDSREWHNPDYDTAKALSSPAEVRQANFRVDSALRQGQGHSLSTARTVGSPFTVDEFQSASIAEAHRDSPDVAMRYVMDYPVPAPALSPGGPGAPPPQLSSASRASGEEREMMMSPFSGQSTPSGVSSLASAVTTEYGSPSPAHVHTLRQFGLSSPGSSHSVFPDSDRSLSMSLSTTELQLPPLDSPDSKSPHRSLPSSPLKATTTSSSSSSSSFGALPSPTSSTPSPSKKGKKKKSKKVSANAGATVVALDVEEAPELMHTRPTKGGFVFTV